MLTLTSDQKAAVDQSILEHAVIEQYEQELQEEADEAEMDATERASQNMKILSHIKGHGLSGCLYAALDPNGILIKRISQSDDVSYETATDAQKDAVVQAICGALSAETSSGMSEEGVREVLHNDKFRHWTGGILSMFYNPLTGAQKAAKSAALAQGLDKAAVSKAVSKAGPSFFRGLFRAMVIGTIADAVIEGGIKIIDKVVNAGRVYGSASEVQDNIKAIQSLLDLIKQTADLKVAVDGSNADEVSKKAEDLLSQIHAVYNKAPSYTMTKGSDTGWTLPLLQSSGKTFDQTVKNTDSQSQAVNAAAQGELALATDANGKPNPAVVRAVKARNRTVAKGIRFAGKLVTTTTRVFTELTHHIETKGSKDVVKDKPAQS